ncbi:cell division ATP-binding protein FtsE [Hoylesella nanceiensis]|jgi:cell-division ATP-binding protein|uniref:ATP-binding cassette domain-containing protein n=1 Tax=Hoylesella nanceiensis TaxID=425941 RepID=A0ABS6Y9P0_9BACT|nr:ATP-binding cassette domain-containing protein [Hoylesella nanceiensis]MBF1428019.1 ATP-binding cassette domain-containing protein [Hoylesella nanceiensis]MBF1434636.1 ATP-binding cassette domain-containing protein [Hoylesella nanceiensis]MBF1437449.1 ATP-binding cassette domain-containing protein [Hoylesella nanceiensis]MBF1440055.1 ATP-binding cassette domain-containing protein [Hoylesella nanceiensis]MBW4768279.1 ATP-binding cassette domain-containing protein [Hoylesella nanceiensis]
MLINYKGINIYQDDKLVLGNVDFHIEQSEFVYLIGKVGSGKSSLLKTIYCELDIDSDDEEAVADVLGRDLKKIKRKEIAGLRRDFGIIFQDFQLLHDLTVYRNLHFVLKATGWKNKKEIDERIDEVLTDVGLLDKKNKMPHELSGGEQQRIAIARALLNKPKVIIADEPTGNLDTGTALDIVALLKEITKKGTAVIMSTHNMLILQKYPGIVYRCEDGVLADVTSEYTKEGTKEE